MKTSFALTLPFLVVFAFSCAKNGTTTSPKSLETLKAEERDQKIYERIARLEATVAMQNALTNKKLELMDSRLADLNNAAEPSPRRPPMPTPDPLKVYAAPTQDAPSQGPKNALVTIVRAYEHACPFCEKSRSTMKALLEKYPKDLRIVYQNFIVHPSQATYPAHAACAANIQGKFRKMEKLIWEEVYAKRNFDEDHIDNLAKQSGVKFKKYKRDLENTCAERQKSTQEKLRAIGVRGTPAFFINGRFLSGARPVDHYEVLIDEELAKAKNRVKSDPKVNKSNYYSKFVLEQGLKSL